MLWKAERLDIARRREQRMIFGESYDPDYEDMKKGAPLGGIYDPDVEHDRRHHRIGRLGRLFRIGP